jgi:uncharacterized protein (DUF58 family)
MKHEGLRLRPTALWIVFGPILVCMWMAAVNYSNNLVYAILYLIASLSFISVFHTWRNLAALQLDHVRIHPAFAGEEVWMEIYLRNPSKRTIYGIFFARPNDEAGRRVSPLLRTNGGTGVRVDPGDSCCVHVVIPTEEVIPHWRWFPPAMLYTRMPLRRGMYRFETLLVRTPFPFGLIWASFRVPVNVDYYIYPKPKGSGGWPAMRPSGEQGSPASNRPGDDFSGVRAYMPGESLRHVDWKAFARGRPLSIKQFTGGGGHELWLNADEMGRMSLEARLSQLALWIVEAEKAEIPYALRLGRTTLPLGLGEAHLRRALEALAVAGMGPG